MPRGRAIQHVGCKMNGCVHSHYGHGFCRKHGDWLRMGRIGASGNILIPVRQKGGRSCKVKDCQGIYASNGFCQYHRTQFRRGIIDTNGMPLRELQKKEKIGLCRAVGCGRADDAMSGFCFRHRYQYREGIIDGQGQQLKPLYNETQGPPDPRSQHKKGEDFVLTRYFDGGPLCSCPVCGGAFEFYQMDGHHPDRSKKSMSPTKMLALTPWNKPELIKELDSLVWQCAHCHIATEAGGEDVPYALTNCVVGKYMDKAMLAILAKKGRQCLDCSRPLGRRTAVFHHRDPAQKIREISQIVGRYSLEFVLREADKCDMLCAPCHKKRHRLDKNLHGRKKDRAVLLLSSPIGKKPKNGRQGCRVIGCGSKHCGRGLCKKHLDRFSRGIIDREGNQLRLPYKRIPSRTKQLNPMPPGMQPPAIPEANF